MPQLKAVPVHSVVPPPIMLHVNVSSSPGQAQLVFGGDCSASLATCSSANNKLTRIVLQNQACLEYSYL